ncbi:MAG TPA: bifunctional phosphoribosylaminoimidazolecarboxamide formyltransferase/inosine monophosphate cyclohydrolase [Solibacterales bacterium]|nr:bifunctional phosphoribosylaminoimidazolecarboxamide formyltransferase/inosine monophosphate cyclohydrolase [Bryobacterales bacterium]
MPQIRRALLSVTDKTGIVEFARQLQALSIELISTGGTAAALRAAGLAVTDVAEVTGFPEMLDGRVKTMHPKITGAILAMRENAGHRASVEEHGIGLIDLVVVNLYQFDKMAARADATREELIEHIDIGGPTMIRSAAKNYQDVGVVVDPADYDAVAGELRVTRGMLSRDTTWRLARKAFRTTAAYDRAISAKLDEAPDTPGLPAALDIYAAKRFDLRYGENPHQSAALYSTSGAGLAGARQRQGKELSYNNLVDLDAAWLLVREFDLPAAAIIKHTNPSGCAENESLAEAYRQALSCDPVSAFGGVIGFNREVDRATAVEVARTFIEAIAAPGFSKEALDVLSAKKNLRLVEVTAEPEGPVLKTITGGYLVQTPDTHRMERAAMQVKTRRAPTDEEWRALEFAWKVTKHVKSNAIVYARDGQTLGIGAGQMSRVDSVRLGAAKAVLPLSGSVVGSDAFFPFPDGLEAAVKNGATAFIQPGGSVRDEDVIAAADKLGAAMVFTGVRHFRH